MSTWTHIHGCIRIDGIPALDNSIQERVRDALGKTCEFDSPEESWDVCNVPCGSEGSLQYQILTVGDGMVLYTVAVWGDLRDYEDEQAIIDWFNKVTVDSGLAIRGAVLSYQTGTNDTKTLQYFYEE